MKKHDRKITWYRDGRALRRELIASGVLRPLGYPRKVLEIDAAAVREAAREIFFESAPPLGDYNIVTEVIDDPASDPRVVADLCALRDWPIPNSGRTYSLPLGYEMDFFAWRAERRGTEGEK